MSKRVDLSFDEMNRRYTKHNTGFEDEIHVPNKSEINGKRNNKKRRRDNEKKDRWADSWN